MTFSRDELSLIAVSGQFWLRMLRAREERTLARIYGEFRNGKTDHLTALAEFACIRDQIREIETALRQHENQPRE